MGLCEKSKIRELHCVVPSKDFIEIYVIDTTPFHVACHQVK